MWYFIICVILYNLRFSYVMFFLAEDEYNPWSDIPKFNMYILTLYLIKANQEAFNISAILVLIVCHLYVFLCFYSTSAIIYISISRSSSFRSICLYSIETSLRTYGHFELHGRKCKNRYGNSITLLYLLQQAQLCFLIICFINLNQLRYKNIRSSRFVSDLFAFFSSIRGEFAWSEGKDNTRCLQKLPYIVTLLKIVDNW